MTNTDLTCHVTFTKGINDKQYIHVLNKYLLNTHYVACIVLSPEDRRVGEACYVVHSPMGVQAIIKSSNNWM